MQLALLGKKIDRFRLFIFYAARLLN